MSLLVIAAVAAFGGLCVRADAARDGREHFALRGVVAAVVDGDTIDVRLVPGRTRERVRLIGIDTPERGTCYADQATSEVRRLAFRKTVRLLGDRSQARRDRYGRLLAYVGLPGGQDLGAHLLASGMADVLIVGRPFARLAPYEAAHARAQRGGAGKWSACESADPAPPPPPVAPPPAAPPPPPVAPPPPAASCHPSYPDVCIPPPPPDLDCGQISFRRFRVVYTVPDPDPHRFDGDRDGVGCES